MGFVVTRWGREKPVRFLVWFELIGWVGGSGGYGTQKIFIGVCGVGVVSEVVTWRGSPINLVESLPLSWCSCRSSTLCSFAGAVSLPSTARCSIANPEGMVERFVPVAAYLRLASNVGHPRRASALGTLVETAAPPRDKKFGSQ